MPDSFRFARRLAWQTWVTPGPLREQPIHRWYVFPHSFSQQLVHQLIDEWHLNATDCILDPFVGAGTTLLAAKEKRVRACGYDLSPLAVLATKVKTTAYKLTRLEAAWRKLRHTLGEFQPNGLSRDYPELIIDALPGKLLSGFDYISASIARLPHSQAERDFFRLALLSIVPEYSRKVATGGWLSWVEQSTRVTGLVTRFSSHVDRMIEDYAMSAPSGPRCEVRMADARSLPDTNRKYSAVITSPPYPNRHDYTRVFGVELMLSLMDWEQTRGLRYQSFCSHPEAHPQRPRASGYEMPRDLARLLESLRGRDCDERIPEMLAGYFLDMYLCLRQIQRVSKRRAKIGFVLGNARYGGRTVPVDKLTAEIGGQAGLTCEKIVITRYRGNSAQQMRRFGKIRSRESIVVFNNDC